MRRWRRWIDVAFASKYDIARTLSCCGLSARNGESKRLPMRASPQWQTSTWKCAPSGDGKTCPTTFISSGASATNLAKVCSSSGIRPFEYTNVPASTIA